MAPPLERPCPAKESPWRGALGSGRGRCISASYLFESWQGRRRYQDLPVSRPFTLARRSVVVVGQRCGSGHRNPPNHWLPVADGAFLLVGRDTAEPRLAGSTPLAWFNFVWRCARSPVSAQDARLERRGSACGDAGLRTQSLRPALFSSYLGCVTPVGWVAMDDRAHHPCGASWRLEVSRAVRIAGGHGRIGERHSADIGGVGSCAMAASRRRH